MHIHREALLRLKLNDPNHALWDARKDLRSMNNCVFKLFNIIYYIHMVDRKHEQFRPLTMELIENVFLYIDNSQNLKIYRVILYTDNAPN